MTLFEGLPYTEWDIRGLAKSVALQSQRSFKFNAKLYEGYHHARTIGNREREWKGEERAARTFVFEKLGGRRRGKAVIVEKRESEDEEGDEEVWDEEDDDDEVMEEDEEEEGKEEDT